MFPSKETSLGSCVQTELIHAGMRNRKRQAKRADSRRYERLVNRLLQAEVLLCLDVIEPGAFFVPGSLRAPLDRGAFRTLYPTCAVVETER